MTQELETSIRLLMVGMTTVFFILTIVVVSSKLLISLINRFEPIASIDPPVQKTEQIPSALKTVLEKAVHQITAGKGKIEKIEKID